MKPIINLYKAEGETPLECIERYQRAHPETAAMRFSYLGRLDPVAEGVLLVADSPTSEERDQICDLDKEYEVEVLFGVATDTFDVLGEITEVTERRHTPIIDTHKALSYIVNLVGTRTEPYPPYSSKPVSGKPLFQWAREGKLAEIEVPTHEVVVHAAVCTKVSAIKGDVLLEKVRERITLVQGDFRQEKCLALWERDIGPLYSVSFPVITLRLHTEAGAYMRQIADQFGRALGQPSLALSIRRLRVGEYHLKDSIH